MNTIDTLKLKLDMDCINSFNPNAFETKELRGPLNEQTGEMPTYATEYILPDYLHPYGLNSLRVTDNCHNLSVLVELSAKILKENYPKLINKNTVDEVEHNLNNEAISLKNGGLLDSLVLRADVVNDLRLSQNPKAYLNELSFTPNNKYDYKLYKNNGITFNKDVQTKKLQQRIIFYDKGIEVLKDKKILKYVDPEIYQNVLRVESNLRSFTQMRRLLEINGDTTLDKVLNSNAAVNHNLLKEIIGDLL